MSILNSRLTTRRDLTKGLIYAGVGGGAIAAGISPATAQTITVKPTHGLTDEQVEQMLLDSIEHAEEDMHARQLAEQRVEGERILADAAKQLRENGDLLQPSERSALEAAMTEVRRLVEAKDADALREAIHALDELAKPFIERVMNRAMTQALAGRSVEQA